MAKENKHENPVRCSKRIKMYIMGAMLTFVDALWAKSTWENLICLYCMRCTHAKMWLCHHSAKFIYSCCSSIRMRFFLARRHNGLCGLRCWDAVPTSSEIGRTWSVDKRGRIMCLAQEISSKIIKIQAYRRIKSRVAHSEWLFMQYFLNGHANNAAKVQLFFWIFLFVLFQTPNCPTMYKDMFYKANKWTVDEPLSMRSGRDRNMADIDAVFTSVYKT